MRGFIRRFSTTKIEIVMLPFSQPLCKNCGCRFERSSITSINGSGRRKLYCDYCNCNCGGKCEYGECGVYERNNKKRLVKNRFDVPDSIPDTAILSFHQKRSGLSSPAMIDRTEVVGEVVFEKCGNPKCKNRTFCFRDTGQTECLEDKSCHKPAWIETTRQRFCSDKCRKQASRSKNLLSRS